ncbi:MAG: Uma2 family endonuclease [Candidatus Tectimicrobiota bacterium]
MFIYYEEGNPEVVVAPDVFVVLGTSKRDRASYMLWREPKGPDFVLEITSRRTRSQDQGPKRGTYAFLGVQEYFQYDPTRDYLVPPLQGRRLLGEQYVLLPTVTLADGTLLLHSSVRGLDLRLEGQALHFYDPATGQPLLTHREAEQARREAEQARQEAEARASTAVAALRAAEARIAELEARLRARE